MPLDTGNTIALCALLVACVPGVCWAFKAINHPERIVATSRLFRVCATTRPLLPIHNPYTVQRVLRLHHTGNNASPVTGNTGSPCSPNVRITNRNPDNAVVETVARPKPVQLATVSISLFDEASFVQSATHHENIPIPNTSQVAKLGIASRTT